MPPSSNKSLPILCDNWISRKQDGGHPLPVSRRSPSCFRLMQLSRSIGNDLFELGGIDNVGNAVGITSLSAIGAKILLFPVVDGRHLVFG